MKNQNEPNANEPIISSPSCQLAPYWQELQEKLLPLVGQTVQSELTDRLQRLAQILEIVRIEEHIRPSETGGWGHPLTDRRPLARAFLANDEMAEPFARAALNLPDTRALMEQLKQSPCFRRLCGMICVPSEAAFSRTFSAFADLKLAEVAHRTMVDKFVGERVVMHTSHDAKLLRNLRDSTAIEARKKAQTKVKQVREIAQGDFLESVKKSVAARKRERNDVIRNRLV